MTMNDWEMIMAVSLSSPNHSYQDIVREVNTIIHMTEESLRKAIADDLRRLGHSRPDLAVWAETLACRYTRGEEFT